MDPRLLDHLAELRTRLIRCGLAFAAATLACYAWHDRLLDTLARPAGKLYFTEPAGAFMAAMKVSALGGLVVSAPILLWQAYAFFKPAMGAERRRMVAASMACGYLLFLAGGALGLQSIKASLGFFMGFSRPALRPLLSVDRYFSFLTLVCLGAALIFQAPVAAFVLARLGLVTRAALLRHWRGAVMAIVIGAAMIAPVPDAFTQLLVALPMAALYGLSIWIVGLVERRAVAPKQGLYESQH